MATATKSILLACGFALAGCGGPDQDVKEVPDGGAVADAASPTLAPTDRFEFVDVRCLPDVAAGEPVVEGQPISCSFRVTGEADQIALRCADGAGDDVDCGPDSDFQLAPAGLRTLPIDNGSFTAATNGRAGTTIAIQWMAEDADEYAAHPFETEVMADDGVNEPPTIAFDCAGDTDGSVAVTAGSFVECRIVFADPDPNVLSWTQAAPAEPPTDEPWPDSGVASAPTAVDWKWQTYAADINKKFVFTFEVSDQRAEPVQADLVIDVE